MKAFKAFIKPFEAPKRIKLNFLSFSAIRRGRLKHETAGISVFVIFIIE